MLQQIKIFPESLSEVESVLLEALTETDSIRYNAENQVFRMLTWIRNDELSRYRPIFCCLYWKKVVSQAWELQLYNVKQCCIEIHDTVPVYEISTLRFVAPETFIINTHYSLTIRLVVDGLKGVLNETKQQRDDLYSRALVFSICHPPSA